MMELDVDVGNSRIKWRLRQDDTILRRSTVLQQAPRIFDADLPWASIRQVNVACVSKPELIERIRVESASLGRAKLFVAKTAEKFGALTNAYSDATLLGVDRWLAMIAAFESARGPCCVVDCGTAITLDFISADGRHEGGYIIPGLNLQRQMLQKGTFAVRAGEPVVRSRSPGITTNDCVLNGIYASLQYGLQGILSAQMKDQAYRTVFTGGDAVDLMDGMPFDVTHSLDLVLDGLAILAKTES